MISSERERNLYCERCDTTDDVEARPSMTAYHWDGEGEDPNRPIALCDRCWDEYRDHWQSMWDEYYSGLL